MTFIRAASYIFLASTLIVSIFILLNSARKTFDSHIHRIPDQNDFNILAHPENYRYPDIQQEQEFNLNGTSVFFDKSDVWTEFLPELYIHSAFADERTKLPNETLIRIIAVGPQLHIYEYKIQCVFQDGESQWRDSVADFNIIRHWSFRYFLFICISKNNKTPQKVGLENISTINKSNFLDIHYPNYKNTPEHEITLCVLPTFRKSDNLQLLAEFLSYCDTVGATSFIFYDGNMAKRERLLLDMISRSGINITIIPWTLTNATLLPKQTILEIASAQHCIFRNRGKTKYVFPVHIDEFLVPRQHFSLTELMNELSTISKEKIGSFVFRESYFCSKDNITTIKDDPLVSSQDIFRENKIRSAKKKSRSMVRPETVMEGGVHFIRKHIHGWRSANVPWQLALIHHYKSCSKNKQLEFIEDRTAESFKYEILLSKPMRVFTEFTKKL